MTEFICLCAIAFASAWGLTSLVRRMALARGLLDIPNQRSSHSVPTPRGGGISIVIVISIAAVYLLWRGLLPPGTFVAVTVGGLAVAAVGYVDDRSGLSPKIRLLVHLVAATIAVIAMGGMPPLMIGTDIVSLGWAGHLLAVIGIVWSLNLFNFMDGIDGIAGSEAVFVCGAAAWFAGGTADASGTAILAAVSAASAAGFLVLNWPPAKVFMGDVGSGYLGYLLAVLALAATRADPSSLGVWLILSGVFFVDATVTLARRLMRLEAFYEAHRSHAYQWQARRWNSHRFVTLSCVALNLFWLAPWAWYAVRNPAEAGWCLLGAWAPLAVLALLAGAGRKERISG